MTNNEKKETWELFEELKTDNITEDEIKNAEKKVHFLGKFSGQFKLLIEMLQEYWKGNFYISNKELLVLIGALSYVALPLDAIPDILPLIGFTDDIVVVKLAVNQLKDLLDRFKEQKKS